MRVLCYISTVFKEGGGISNVMLNYYREIWRQSDRPSKLVIDFMSYGEIDEKLSAEVSEHGGSYYQLPKRTSNPIRHIKEYIRALEGEPYDILHFNYDSGLDAIELWESRWRVPLVICHVHNTKLRYNYISSLVKPIVRMSCNYALACSQTAGESLFGDSTPFAVLNNAINIDKFSYDSVARMKMRKRLGIADNVFCVGTVGRMSIGNQKNTDFLIRLYSVLHKMRPSTSLVIVGDGELMSDWRALVNQLGVKDSVTFAGFQTNVVDYMQAFDIFCFPSKWEGLGTVAIEAQALGLTVLASDAVPNEVKLTDHLRFLPIGEGDEEVWAREIIKDMDEEYDRGATKDCLREQLRNGGYDIATEAEKLLKIYGCLSNGA